MSPPGNRGGTLPTGSLTFTFTIVLFISFLALMFSNIASSAPPASTIDANSYLSGAGNINETTNPVGLTSGSSGFSPLAWVLVGIMVVVGMIIVATLIPGWI